MKLSELQLAAGLAAVGAYLTPGYGELSHWQRAEIKKQLAVWLSPILLKLPDSATGAELRDGVYQYELIEAAQQFELRKLRELELFDNHSDDDLRRRLSPEVVQVSATNLTVLTAIALEAVATLPAEVQLATVLQQQEDPVAEIEQALDDPELLAEELAKFME